MPRTARSKKQAPAGDDDKPRWSGPVVRRVGSDKYYGAFVIAGTSYAAGDTVLLRNAEAEAARAKAKRARQGKRKRRPGRPCKVPKFRNWVAEIVSMWEDCYREKWFECRW